MRPVKYQIRFLLASLEKFLLIFSSSSGLLYGRIISVHKDQSHIIFLAMDLKIVSQEGENVITFKSNSRFYFAQSVIWD